MTKRQEQLRDFVVARRDEILVDVKRELDPHPIGFTTQVRLVAPTTFRFMYLLVMKTANGYQWREDSHVFRRKGYTAPAWKALA